MFNYHGEEGYLRLVQQTMEPTRVLQNAIRRIPQLEILGHPAMSVFAYGSRTLDMPAVADGMIDQAWRVGRLTGPPGSGDSGGEP